MLTYLQDQLKVNIFTCNLFYYNSSFTEILETITNIAENYSSPVKLWLGPELFFVTSDPNHYDIIFNDQNALGKSYVYDFVMPFAGHGLFSAPG